MSDKEKMPMKRSIETPRRHVAAVALLVLLLVPAASYAGSADEGPGVVRKEVIRVVGDGKGPWLGVSLEERRGTGEPESPGVLIGDVFDGSPAAEAGLKAGDLIVSFGGVETPRLSVLMDAIRSHAAGDRVPVTVLRDGSRQSHDVTLSSREESGNVFIGGPEGMEHLKGLVMDLEGLEDLEDLQELEDLDLEGLHEGIALALKDLPHGIRGEEGLKWVGALELPDVWIGITMQDVTPELRTHFGSTADAGVLIGKVDPDSPAARAGVAVGDLLVKVNDRTIQDPSDVTNAIRDLEAGSKVSLELLRNGSTFGTDAVLEKRPEGQMLHRMFRISPGDHDVRFLELGKKADEETIRRRIEALKERMHALDERLQKMNDQLREAEAAGGSGS